MHLCLSQLVIRGRLWLRIVCWVLKTVEYLQGENELVLVHRARSLWWCFTLLRVKPALMFVGVKPSMCVPNLLWYFLVTLVCQDLGEQFSNAKSLVYYSSYADLNSFQWNSISALFFSLFLWSFNYLHLHLTSLKHAYFKTVMYVTWLHYRVHVHRTLMYIYQHEILVIYVRPTHSLL